MTHGHTMWYLDVIMLALAWTYLMWAAPHGRSEVDFLFWSNITGHVNQSSQSRTLHHQAQPISLHDIGPSCTTCAHQNLVLNYASQGHTQTHPTLI
jgi:hypothetical protein